MLSRLESAPAAIFYEKELLALFPREFEDAKANGLLSRAPAIESYSYELSRPRVVVAGDDGLFEAYDEDDPEEEPLLLNAADLARWRLNVDRVVALLRERNHLEGTPEALSDRLHFAGEAHTDGNVSAVVLALLDERSALPALRGVPSQLPDGRFDRVIAVCPTFVPTPTVRRELQTSGIALVPYPTRGDSALNLEEVDGASTATRVGGLWPPCAAAFVDVLRQARQGGVDVLRWAQIKDQLKSHGFYPHRARDVRRGVRNWDDVVLSPRQGYYSLKR